MDPIMRVIWKALTDRGWQRREFDVWVLPSIGRPMSTHDAVVTQMLREMAA